MMTHAHKAAPEPQAILRAWMPFKKAVGVTSVRTEGDYAQARATIEALIDEIGEDENHLRVPVHGGHHSDLMTVSVPGPWRPVFRRYGGHFRLFPGTLTVMPGIAP